MSHKLNDDMPAWKRKHLEEQERRMKEAELEAANEKEREQQKLIEIEQAKVRAEEERQRLAAEIAQRREKELEEEMAKKAAEAQLRMQQFSGAAAKAERDKILEEQGLKKAAPKLGGTSNPQIKVGSNVVTGSVSPRGDTNSAIPEWKRKKMEQEAAEKKRIEEEAKAKAQKLASLEPVFEVK